MVTSTEDLVMSLSSNWTVPLRLVNAPRTVEMARCLTANCAAECAGSICQVVVAAAAGSERAAARPAAIAMREKTWPMSVASFKCYVFAKLKSTAFIPVRERGLPLTARRGSLSVQRAGGRTDACEAREQADRDFSKV